MPKGLIPLFAGLGAAGTMVGISIPSAVTVIPKKEETPKYTGWVFEQKIYKTELEAKQALVTSLNAIGPKDLGSIKYTVAGATGTQTETFKTTAPTTAILASQYSYGPVQNIMDGEINSTVDFNNSSMFPDFAYSLQPISSSPVKSMTNVDVGMYVSNFPGVQWSGGKVLSTKNNKYYWYADLEHEAGVILNLPGSGHTTSWTDSDIPDSIVDWGEAGDINNSASADFAIRFRNDHHQPIGSVVYIHTNLTESQIKAKDPTNYMNYIIAYSPPMPIPGAPGTAKDKYDLLKGTTKIGETIVASGAVAPTITATDITISNTVAPVAWTVANLTPVKLSAITKVHPTTEVVSGQPWTPYNTISSPTSIYKEVNNG